MFQAIYERLVNTSQGGPSETYEIQGDQLPETLEKIEIQTKYLKD